MGVDFYVCRACDETFPDCGPYVRCEGCGKPYCGDEKLGMTRGQLTAEYKAKSVS